MKKKLHLEYSLARYILLKFSGYDNSSLYVCMVQLNIGVCQTLYPFFLQAENVTITVNF